MLHHTCAYFQGPLPRWTLAQGPILYNHNIRDRSQRTTMHYPLLSQHRIDEGPRGPERTRTILEVTQPVVMTVRTQIPNFGFSDPNHPPRQPRPAQHS